MQAVLRSLGAERFFHVLVEASSGRVCPWRAAWYLRQVIVFKTLKLFAPLAGAWPPILCAWRRQLTEALAPPVWPLGECPRTNAKVGATRVR